jgi:sulfur-carrier protein adenylyltransferase/sulfurtransferase
METTMNTPNLDDRGLPAGYAFDASWEITPRETKSMMDGGTDFVLIDCRLPQELTITSIAGAEHVPLQHIQAHGERLMQWQKKKVVVFCKVGGRSLQFAKILRQNGFEDVRSMAGGILLWNADVRPGGPVY